MLANGVREHHLLKQLEKRKDSLLRRIELRTKHLAPTVTATSTTTTSVQANATVGGGGGGGSGEEAPTRASSGCAAVGTVTTTSADGRQSMEIKVSSVSKESDGASENEDVKGVTEQVTVASDLQTEPATQSSSGIGSSHVTSAESTQPSPSPSPPEPISISISCAALLRARFIEVHFLLASLPYFTCGPLAFPFPCPSIFIIGIHPLREIIFYSQPLLQKCPTTYYCMWLGTVQRGW